MKKIIRLCAFADEAAESLDGQIAALKRNGIEYLELRSIGGVNVKDITLSQAETYQKALQENGIKVWAIGSPLGKVDVDCDFTEYEKTARHIFTLANIFKAQRVRVFSFFNAYQKEERVFAHLKRLVEIGKEYGVILCHENEKEIYGDTVERVLRLKKSVEDLAFVYDPANYLQVGEDAANSLKNAHAISEYYHIKDVISATDELVPAGEGDGKIEELIDRVDGEKVLTLEPHLSVFAGYAAIDDTVMKNKYAFKDGNEAFDAAANALKALLKKAGYKEIKGEFRKA